MSSNLSEKNKPSDTASNAVSEQRVTGTMAYLSLGFEFLGAFLMFAGFGYFLDYMLTESGRPGFGLIIGLFLGFGGGIWHLIRRTNELQAWEEAYAAERREAEQAGTITPTTEDIHIRMQRVQRGVDSVHRKLGAALDPLNRAVKAKTDESADRPAGPES